MGGQFGRHADTTMCTWIYLSNKSTIVGKGGMDKLIKLSARFADDPSVLQEVRTCNILI